MKSCLIIGGGLSGLAAAVDLASKNYQVTILEASPKPGGKAYSYFDQHLQATVDNGQHIIMGCYNATLDFIHTINAADRFLYQDALNMHTVNRNGKRFALHAAGTLYPINLAVALFNYGALSFTEQLQAVWLLLKSVWSQPEDCTLDAWLLKNNQSANTIRALWEFLAVGALNTSMHIANAGLFIKILRRIFLHGNFASTIILPKQNLSDSFITPAVEFITARNGKVITSARVTRIVESNNSIQSVHTQTDSYSGFDFVICTVPAHAIEKIEGLPQAIGNPDLTISYSSILTVHIKNTSAALTRPFYGLIGSPVNWVFNHGTILTTVSSDADALVQKSDEEILELVNTELAQYLSVNTGKHKAVRIIREKRATFVPNTENLTKRIAPKTPIANLYMAGDWINTGLPATIESAVLSGKEAARLALTASEKQT